MSLGIYSRWVHENASPEFAVKLLQPVGLGRLVFLSVISIMAQRI